MTATDTPATAAALAWQTYQAEERHARTEYLAAVNTAQQHFTADVKPAMDTYHSAERAAWQAYNINSRAAKRRYLDATTQLAIAAADTPPPLPAAQEDTPDSPDRGPWYPRPEFHPYPETES